MAENEFQTPKDPSLLKVPPQSIEAEESILSAILIDNDSLMDVLEILTPDDFFRTAHKRIFAVMEELFSITEQVVLVSLTNLLRDKGHLD